MKSKKIHMIGIGGISMSGIALLLQSKGYIISGSDIMNGENLEKLRIKNIKITIGTDINNIQDTDMVIYSSSIKENNEELLEAKRLNKTIYNRSEFMGLICQMYKNVICISGTHGKSTTTGLVSLAFIANELDPTILIGANLKEINGNCRIGNKEYLILETCEFKDSFLHFLPTSEIILNIDDDHLDYFKNIDNIKKSFNNFIKIKTNKYLVINVDDKNIKDLSLPDIKILTIGILNQADLNAKNITFDEYGYPIFDIYYNNKLLVNIHLAILGNHNIYNALCAVALTLFYNLDILKTKKGIESYSGVKRRFEHIGTYKNNIEVYDDYAHHPTEMLSTLSSVNSLKHHKCFAIFQSHTYSRTIEHLDEFAKILSKFDNIIIAPIFAAREQNIYNIHESDLVNLINKSNKNVIYIDSFDNIVTYLQENLQEDDLVITIGAGPINQVGLKLLNK